MIRMIASDMDGTLLRDGAQELSPRMFRILERLCRRDILFTAASGRQYANLRNLLGPFSDRAAYICENGAFAVYQGQIICRASMDRALGQALMKDIQETDGCEIQLSGVETAYIQPKDPSYVRYLTYTLKNRITQVEDIFSTKEPYIKISAYVHGDHTREYLERFREKWGDTFTLASTCDHWIDFIPPGIHKGKAMEALMERTGISREETMAFGDNYNDLELLACAAESYAVDTAKPEVIAASRHVCRLVEDVLEAFLDAPF